jgi:hypothetical protein
MKTKLDASVIAIIKLARSLGYKYETIAAYFVINQGRIADVMCGRIGRDVAPAAKLPNDFPELTQI